MSSKTGAADRIKEAQNGNASELEELILEHQGLIRMLAYRLRCEQESREELIQAGNLGLMHAIIHFAPSHNVKLITYAVPWILGEMRKAIRRTEAYSLDQPTGDRGITLYDILTGSLGIDIGQLNLRLAIARLNSDEQRLIILRYYRDKTQSEAASLLGKSQTQVSRLERRALDKLYNLLS